MSSTFLRHRDTNYLVGLHPSEMQPERIRIGLLGAMRYGKPFVLDLMEDNFVFNNVCSPRFDEVYPGLMKDIITKNILKPEIYEKLGRSDDPQEYSTMQIGGQQLDNFSFIVLTNNQSPPQELLDQFVPIWIE
ncbi:unnamed protein product [Calicophoron daubneyi]